MRAEIARCAVADWESAATCQYVCCQGGAQSFNMIPRWCTELSIYMMPRWCTEFQYDAKVVHRVVNAKSDILVHNTGCNWKRYIGKGRAMNYWQGNIKRLKACLQSLSAKIKTSIQPVFSFIRQPTPCPHICIMSFANKCHTTNINAMTGLEG